LVGDPNDRTVQLLACFDGRARGQHRSRMFEPGALSQRHEHETEHCKQQHDELDRPSTEQTKHRADGSYPGSLTAN